jgi:hypothetical protein
LFGNNTRNSTEQPSFGLASSANSSGLTASRGFNANITFRNKGTGIQFDNIRFHIHVHLPPNTTTSSSSHGENEDEDEGDV